MGKHNGRASRKAGMPPGSLVHIGETHAGPVTITVIDYDETHLEERRVDRAEDCLPFKERDSATWINVTGVSDVGIIEAIGTVFGIHPLVMEDIVHTDQRPKVEDFGDYLFIVLRMLHFQNDQLYKGSEQVSLILGRNLVISFLERPADIFDPVLQRLRSGKGRIRKKPSDYLAYVLMDTIIDNYFIVLENLGETIEDLEDELVTDPSPATLQVIQLMKREMIYLRKSVWPLREALSGLQRGESDLITDGVRLFLRDIYDHTIQIIDTIETFRDLLSGLLDIYLSSVSNRMNEIMKVLTIMASIFIPLTFLAGIYGMNFKYMPELGLPWAYPVLWLVMIVTAAGLLLFFKRKRWL
jgi:magnesium transporter